jgi:hypothetical protein
MSNLTTEFDTQPKLSEKTSVSITNVRPASPSEWDIIWRECYYSTYFHSREWAEIWSCYTKGKMALTPLLVMFSDGKSALLPFSCLTEEGVMPILTGTRKLYVSSSECSYGGWISSDKLLSNHAILLVNLVKQKFKNLIWRMNPYDDLALKCRCNIPRESIDNEGETHSINLEKGFDIIASNMSRDHRRAVKKAIQNGVSVRISSSIEDWKDYYKVYEITVSRWGNRLQGDKYSWELFYDIFRRNSPNTELWLAIYQDKVISGELCFHSKKHFVSWHGASNESYFNLRPRNLLLYEAIKNACEKGYIWFDFNPSAGLQGVKSFKEGFGAEALKCPIVRLRPRNIRTFTMGKVNDKVFEIKKRANCTLSTTVFKKIFNHQPLETA